MKSNNKFSSMIRNYFPPVKFSCSLLMSIMASVGAFIMPIAMGANTDNLTIVSIAVFILIINSFSFSQFCEIVKLKSANNKNVEQYGMFYKYCYKTNNPALLNILFNCVIAGLTVAFYYCNTSDEHIKGLALYASAVCFAYSVGTISFDAVRKGNVGFRKRDYLLLKPFYTTSFPLACGVFITDMLNEHLQYVSLLLVFCVYAVINCIIIKKQLLNNESAYTIVNICAFAITIVIYIVLEFSKPGFVFYNFKALLLSIFYGVYLSCLLSLSYSYFFPIQTPVINHSITKFQTSIFNFAPAAAFPLLLYYFDNSYIIYLFMVINTIAVMCTGRSGKSFNLIITSMLVLGFIGTILIMFRVDGFYIRTYDIKFNPEFSALSLFVSVILAAPLTWLYSKKKNDNLPEYVRENFSYFFTTIIGQVVLLLIMSFFHVSKEENSFISEQSDFTTYVYIAVNLIIWGGRLIYGFKSELKRSELIATE